jgi:predicted aspartyl protease
MRRRRTVLPLAFTLIFGLASSAGRVVLAEAPTSVPLRMTGSGLVTVSVTINGGGPYTFVLDTGSNRTGVSAQLAARLTLPAVATTTVVSSTGTATGNVIRLDEIALGRVVRRDLLTVVMPVDLTTVGLRADGVLGQDFLSDETYTIDYGRRRLVWDAVEPRGTRLALKRDEGRWLVALPQDTRGSDVVWFVPDSGAQGLVVFDRGIRLPLRLTALPDVAISTAAGSATTRAALVRLLRVGPVELADQPAVVIDRRAPDGPAGDGLLPLCLFSTVTFNGKEGYLAVGR